MANMMSVEKSTFTNSMIDYYRQNKVGEYSKYLDKNPVFVTYYHISTNLTRVDVGTGGIEHEIGERSPVRFNKLTEFPIYNIPELKPDLVYDETGYDIDLDLNGLVILPNTIRPLPGDYFIVSFPGIKEYLFRVKAIRYNTIQSNDFYEIDADIKDIGENLEVNRKITAQIVATYRTVFEKIGTDDRCFIQESDVDTVNQLVEVYDTLKTMYQDAFYNQLCNSFVFPVGYNSEGWPSVLYDPYLEKFINQSHLYYVANQEKSLILHPNDILDPQFNYIYSRTLYHAIINKNMMLLHPNIYVDISPITKKFSPFVMNSVWADSIKLFLGSDDINASLEGSKPVWFAIDCLPCCGPTWTPSADSKFGYFSIDFIHSLICGDLKTDYYYEVIIFNYLHDIKDQISISELIKNFKIHDPRTFYYIPIVCFILSSYYEEYFNTNIDIKEI